MTKDLSTLQFTIAQSQWRLYLVHGLHALSITACWLNSLAVPLQLAATLLVLASWVVQYKASCTKEVYLRYSTTDAWTISYDGETFALIKIKAETVISSLLSVLHFEAGNLPGSLLIFKDALSADQYRKLIVQLKISGLSFN